MLYELIVVNRELIVDRAWQRVRARMPRNTFEPKLEHGIPIFLTQLIEALVPVARNPRHSLEAASPDQAVSDAAALHGIELLRSGFTVAQVVHGYGDVCQIVTKLASEAGISIGADEFQMFNHCLDDAIAGAVTGYGRQRETDLAHQSAERRGVLAHEARKVGGPPHGDRGAPDASCNASRGGAYSREPGVRTR